MAEAAIQLPEMVVTGKSRKGYPNILAKAYHQAYSDQLPPFEEFADSLLQADPQIFESMAEYLHKDRYHDIDRDEFDDKTGLKLYRDHIEGPSFMEGLTDSFT